MITAIKLRIIELLCLLNVFEIQVVTGLLVRQVIKGSLIQILPLTYAILDIVVIRIIRDISYIYASCGIIHATTQYQVGYLIYCYFKTRSFGKECWFVIYTILVLILSDATLFVMLVLVLRTTEQLKYNLKILKCKPKL